MRTFERTHPWISFYTDLGRAPASLWIALGECQSKCEHIAKVPLRPDTSQKLQRVYLAKGAAATTAIEGNTLTEEQVQLLLEGKLTLPPSQQYLQNEVQNIIDACNLMLDAIIAGKAPTISSERIREINRLVLRNLELAPEVIPGEFRTHSVTVGRYVGAPAEDCEFLVNELCDWLNGEDFQPSPGLEIAYAILKAIVAHLYIAWIHPFGDGNGRTARLVEFQVLIASGVPAPAAHLLSNHFNLTRTEYYRQLDRASKSGGDILPFVTYAVQGLWDGLKAQLNTIWEQQWDITWRNYVHELFPDKSGMTQHRRRHLVLDLSRESGSVPIGSMTGINPRITNEYAHKTRKTLIRDLNELMRLGLIEKGPEGYRAKLEIILSFLPPKASPGSK